MPWIESHTTIGNHPKTRKLARRLGVPVPEAVGLLHLLWHWALEYAQDGDLSHCDPVDIADGAQFEGEPEAFIDALIGAGYVDKRDNGHSAIHDWNEYAGRYTAMREQRRRAAMKRWHPDTGAKHPHNGAHPKKGADPMEGGTTWKITELGGGSDVVQPS